MEKYDPRRRLGGEDESRRYPPHNEERGRDRESLRPDDDRNQRRERSNFSPDWSREGAEPRYSDDPYYSRNRDRPEDYSSGSSRDYARGGWRDDDRSRWEQRARESIPREQRELAERSRSAEYYSPDWPYERGQSRDLQRSREDEQGGHYRGYYSRSTVPFAYPGGQGYLYSEAITLHGPYTGRGPKGYKRSDQQLIEEASQRLERDGHIDASEIEVTAEEGVITLQGTVPDRRTKRRAEECVESVYGARDVMNHLRVSSQGGQSQEREQSQGSQTTTSLGSQSAQASQRAQSSRGSQASPSSASTQRGGTAMPSAEQSGEDKRPPKH